MIRRTFFVLFLLAVAFGVYAAYAVLTPYRGFTGQVFVDLRRGAGTIEIAEQLAEAGVIRSRAAFFVLRLARPRQVLKAGEYRFDRELSTLEVYRKIAAGEIFYYSVTAPEGYNMFEIADAVARTGVITRDEFLQQARRGDRAASFAPGAPTLEGFLFPDTYRITRHETAEELVGQMLRRFRDVFSPLQAAAGARPGNALETVTLASLIEKETAVASERPVVASVYRNRLNSNMPLQCDPTVIYALELAGRYNGQIHKEDLALPSPYNTYVHPGLPPGPIANPGRASLQAALAPADTKYLYFVADAKGGHVFSENLDRHEEAVARYLRSNGRKRR